MTHDRRAGAARTTFERAKFFFRQWKTLRTTNTIERLHEEFRRRVKTQGSLPSEDAAVVLLFSLVASGQIKLRRIEGWRKIAAVPANRGRVGMTLNYRE
jgi:transposase-like protein